MSNIWAIIPARSGSKGVPNKNIRPIQGHPLLAYAIASAKKTYEVEKVVVSTDSEEYAEIAKKYGADVPFLRPKEISCSNSTDYQCLEHATLWFAKHEGVIPDKWLHLRPTTPLRYPKILSKAIMELRQNPRATSLRSAHLASESPLKWFVKNDKQFAAPLLPDLSLEEINNPRQSFPDVFVPNGYIDIILTKIILEKQSLHGDNILVFETDVTPEIDTFSDLEFVDFNMTRKIDPQVSNFLSQI